MIFDEIGLIDIKSSLFKGTENSKEKRGITEIWSAFQEVDNKKLEISDQWKHPMRRRNAIELVVKGDIERGSICLCKNGIKCKESFLCRLTIFC